MSKKTIKELVFFIIILICIILVFPKPCIAKTISDANQKKKELKSKIADSKKEEVKYKKLKKELKLEIKKLDGKLNAVSDKIEKLDNKIDKIKKNIIKQEDLIKKTEKKQKKIYLLLKRKIKFMYENNEFAGFSAILEAKSMGELLNRQEYINAIYTFDKDNIDELKQLAKEIREKKEELKKKKTDLETSLNEAETQKAKLLAITKEKQDSISSFEAKIKSQRLKQRAYEYDIIEQDKLIAKIIKAEKLRKQREEAKRKAEQAKKSNENGSKVITGKFVWPCPGYKRISSEFGYRIHPTLKIKKLHNGIDMAAGVGTNIVAAASGTVVAAGYNATMGNYLMINHGNELITVYMHCSRLKVGNGAYVSAGQSIASVGSTGRSTGPHLHFGVNKNGVFVNPWNYLR